MMNDVLILRPDNIGDCVLFSGALKEIRKRWPNAHIDLAVQRHIVPLFELCPHVDRILDVDRLMPWRRLRRMRVPGAWRLAEWMQRGERIRWWAPSYDHVLCPVSASTEELLDCVRQIRAGQKIGFSGFRFQGSQVQRPENKPERVFSMAKALTEQEHWEHELERNRTFLELCGIEPTDIAPEFWLSKPDLTIAKAYIPVCPVLGLFPGSSSRFRLWPTEKWIELIRTQEHFSEVVVFGAQSDRDVTSPIIAGLNALAHVTCIDLTGRTSLRELVACIQRCAALVSMETSALHMAVASGIPTVGLMGGHHYGRYYPWGDTRIHHDAHVGWECFPCRQNCQHDDFRCVREISVETVLRELRAATPQTVEL